MPNQDQLIKLLVNKRVDVAIMFDDVASYTLKTMGVDGAIIKKGQRNHVSDIYVAFSKKHADSVALAKKLDDGLRQLKARGEYQKIVDVAVSAGP
ncbi:MAG: transporter substrate-binding domain-containing protein [Pseudomonadales bacterium]|nr:transporter substrate-binding domain-containing protein [Pseudomonadales bacterium]